MTTETGTTHSPPTIAVLGMLRFPPDRVQEVLPYLQLLVETTRKSDGCIAYDVAVDPFDPGLIRFSELWPNVRRLRQFAATQL
jgi:quinol monooxygenase YgiN